MAVSPAIIPGNESVDRSQEDDERRRFDGDGDRDAFVGESGRRCSCCGRIASWSRRAAARFLQTWARRGSGSTAVLHVSTLYLPTQHPWDGRRGNYVRERVYRAFAYAAVRTRRKSINTGTTPREEFQTTALWNTVGEPGDFEIRSSNEYHRRRNLSRDELLALTLHPKSELDLKPNIDGSWFRRISSVRTLEL